MEQGADDVDVGVGVAEVFADFGEPFGDAAAIASRTDAVGSLDVIEDDPGGAPVFVGDATQLGAGGEGVHADRTEAEGPCGSALQVGQFPGKDRLQARVVGQGVADGSQAELRLTQGGREHDDVGLGAVEQGMDGEDESDQGGFGGAAGCDGDVEASLSLKQGAAGSAGASCQHLKVHGVEGQAAGLGEEVPSEVFEIGSAAFTQRLLFERASRATGGCLETRRPRGWKLLGSGHHPGGPPIGARVCARRGDGAGR